MTTAEAQRAYGNLTSEQQSALDRSAGELGVSVLQLMEIAGWQVARWVHAMAAGGPVPIAVVAGHGNNGGDGLVAARHLLSWGFPVAVALVAEPERLGEPVATHLRAVRALGARVEVAPDGRIPAPLLEAAIVVDALLGSGIRGDPRPAQAAAISLLPADRTVAVDVPSGLDATTGSAGTPTVRALRTCTLAAMKAGLWTPAGRRHAGEITVADIGIPASAWVAIGLEPPALVRGGELLTIPTDTAPPVLPAA
ncbi:MAG: NAD(P)H-hydrate epimerase [Candidatus Dormibacteria bacterium]